MAPKDRLSADERVVRAITTEMIEGRLKPGDKLLTEPELSKLYGVGRNSVREAVKQLEAFGVLEIRRADGTYVCGSYDGRMMDPMLYSLILNEHDWKDFIRLRAVIDIGTLYEVMRSEDIDTLVIRLRHILSRMREELGRRIIDFERVMELDLKFHEYIYKHINNAQINTINDYIARLTVPSRVSALRRWIENKEMDRFYELHMQIAEIIEQGDRKRIEEVINAHYVYWG